MVWLKVLNFSDNSNEGDPPEKPQTWEEIQSHPPRWKESRLWVGGDVRLHPPRWPEPDETVRQEARWGDASWRTEHEGEMERPHDSRILEPVAAVVETHALRGEGFDS